MSQLNMKCSFSPNEVCPILIILYRLEPKELSFSADKMLMIKLSFVHVLWHSLYFVELAMCFHLNIKKIKFTFHFTQFSSFSNHLKQFHLRENHPKYQILAKQTFFEQFASLISFSY